MKKLITSLAVILLTSCFIAEVNARRIYKCVEQGGSISYQERPCVNKAETMLAKRGIVDNNSYRESLKSLTGSLGSMEVTMLAFDWWRVFRKEIDDRFLHFKFTDDEGDTPITLLVDFIVPDSSDALLDKEIKLLFTQKAEKFLNTSVETKLTPKKMKVNDGLGYYQTFTDKNLVGKSTYPAGEYLYTTSGLMAHGDVMVNFTLLSNDYTAQNHIFALGFLENGVKIETSSGDSIDVSNLSYLEQAAVALKEQKIVDLVELFRLSTLEEPENFQTWFGYCLSLREVNRLQSAFIACNNAKKIAPSEVSVDYEILNLLIKARLFDAAFDLGKKLFAEDPSANHIETIINLGYFAMQEQAFDQAEAAFGFLMGNDIESAKLTHDRAMLAHAQGNNQVAIEIVKTLKGMGESSDAYVNLFIEVVQGGGTLFSLHENEEPYVLVPKRFEKIVSGEIDNVKIDPWVTQRFHVKGVGLLEVKTPENWVARPEIDSHDGNHVLSLKVFDPLAMTKMIGIDLGKVASDWTLEDAKKQMAVTLNVFFPEKMPQFKALKVGESGFELDEMIEKESAEVRIRHQVLLDGIIQYNVNMTSLNANVNDKAVHDRVFDSIRMVVTDQTPLDQVVDSVDVVRQIYSNSYPKKEYDPGLELPEPPAGYKWHKMNNIMAIFLAPDGWHRNMAKAEIGITHAVSKEPASESLDFNTGLTVIGSKTLLKKLELSVSQYALGMAQLIDESDVDTLIDIKSKTNESFKSYIIQYENHPTGEVSTKIHQVISGNIKTGSVYMILFEAPKDEWDKAWKVGEVILQNYLLDDEF